MIRTADTIEEAKAKESVQPATDSPTSSARDLAAEMVDVIKDAAKDMAKEASRARRLANLVAPWPKGVSGNPKGRRKNDLAKEIAEAVFEENREAIYEAMVKPLLQGNAYAYSVLADRAFGKLKELKEVTYIHEDTPDAELGKRIEQLERDLGLARAIDDAGRVGIAAAGTEPTNGKAKVADVLS
jgi:hypothetical protein